MKIQSNVFVISVLILGLITSPLSFAQTSEDDSENITIELDESLSITSENAEPEDTDEEEVEDTDEEEEGDHEERSFGDKITICHIPPGNPSKAHTITVGGNAVDAHSAHGDEIGSCTLGQEVSNFVHESRDLFKQQGEETRDVIVQCREDMKNAEPSDRKSVREQCKSNLKEV